MSECAARVVAHGQSIEQMKELVMDALFAASTASYAASAGGAGGGSGGNAKIGTATVPVRSST